MRRTFVVALMVAVSFAAQAAPTALLAQDPDWQKKNDAWIAKYSADRAKDEARTTKALDDLDKREDSWRSLGRDFFGLTNNAYMDPDYYDRVRRVRRQYKVHDDSAAAVYLDARKGASPEAAVNATRTRIIVLRSLIPANDSTLAWSKRLLKDMQITFERAKSDENPSLPPEQKQYMKRVIDYYDKRIRSTRLEIDHHTKSGDAWRAEVVALEKEMAAIKAPAPQ